MIRFYLCNALCVSSTLWCGNNNCRALLLRGVFPALLLSRVLCLWVRARREGFMQGELGSPWPRRDQTMWMEELKWKKKKIRVPEAGGVLIILDNCSKLTLLSTVKNTKIWYTNGRHSMVNLYSVTGKLAFRNKLAIIKVIFASPFTLSWGNKLLGIA